MQVYFSHSYRDVGINGYFIDQFDEERIPLHADQKTDIWCVAKLERYLIESTGFVSIIPRRPTDADPGGYSPYIGQELSLARRARTPLLLFVDRLVLDRHRLEFPEAAVSFDPEDLSAETTLHADAIREFGARLESAHQPPSRARQNEVAVIAGKGSILSEAAEDVSQIVYREGYHPMRVGAGLMARSLDDVELLETLWRAELCVFVLPERISDAQIALAMAYAHGIPSVRLQYDPQATTCSPSVSGLVRWASRDDMVIELARQLAGYREGFVSPLADFSDGAEAAQMIGTMRWRPREENTWREADGEGLAVHVKPEQTFVQDEVARTRTELGGGALGRVRGRAETAEVCAHLFDGLRRRRYSYEFEAFSSGRGVQVIRTPYQIMDHKCATCLDLACLFASLIEAAHQNPLVVVIEGKGFAHALAGYRVQGEPTLDNPSIGDVRGALARGDIVLFEATGAVEADRPVAAETPAERIDKMLGYADALAAADRMLRRDVRLRHFVDVAEVRAGGARARS